VNLSELKAHEVPPINLTLPEAISEALSAIESRIENISDYWPETDDDERADYQRLISAQTLLNALLYEGS
jgi:hypothetical protein